jgi:hypothetical protein
MPNFSIRQVRDNRHWKYLQRYVEAYVSLQLVLNNPSQQPNDRLTDIIVAQADLQDAVSDVEKNCLVERTQE